MTAVRFAQAIAAVDDANADDPNLIDFDGRRRPKELVHAELMTEWVETLSDASDELELLAARAHHVRRWESPRASFPDGRRGYLRWRAQLARRHGELVEEIDAPVGYDASEIARVRSIVEKKDRVTDPAVQRHEDARCLVFLQLQFSELAARLGDDRMVEVLGKTIAKMSPAGLAAIADLELSSPESELIEAALRSV